MRLKVFIKDQKINWGLQIEEKFSKRQMTFETITDHIHEYMYDRLKDSNYSNDGRNEKYVVKILKI